MLAKKIFFTTNVVFAISVIHLLSGFFHITTAQAPVTKHPSSDVTPNLDNLPDISDNVATLNKVTTPKVAKSETVSAKPVSGTIGKPKQLIIPSININTKIEHIGLTREGAVGVPAGAVNVSWFSAGPKPGQKGSAVISGHSGIWGNGTHSVFDPLPNMKAGDIIYVKDDQGKTLSFQVKEKRVYGKDEAVPEIFNKSDKAYLNIITCHGDYLPAQKTYSKRLVVFAEAIQ